MSKYSYRARNTSGKVVKGEVEAATEDKAVALLHSNSLIPLEVKVIDKHSIWDTAIFGGAINTKELILFCRQLASMVRAGVPITESLESLIRQTVKESYVTILQHLIRDIEAGDSLSGAMSKHMSVFSPFVLGVVRIGEASGQLSQSLDYIADYLEQDYVFMRKVWATLTYPGIVLVVVILLVIIMFTFVLPQLVSLFGDAGVDLPLTTRVLIGMTNFLRDYWWMIIIAFVSLGLVFRSYVKTPDGKYTVSAYFLRIPLVSSLFKKIYLARITSVMHTLFKSDLPVIESLELTRDTVGNRVYAQIMDDTANAVKDGAAISSVWEHEYYIDPMLTTMVSVGERSGKVAESFAEANRFFKREITSMLDTISTLLEPILIIILCIGVGIVVSAILLPIYNLVLVL